MRSTPSDVTRVSILSRVMSPFFHRAASHYFTPSGLAAQLRSHGHVVDSSAIEVDRTTIHRLPGHGEIVTDRSIFHALGIDGVKALDASAYEGAEIVHDLNRPLPDNLKAMADFIVDGSTLDNVFDPAMTLRNYAQLLRPGAACSPSTRSIIANVRSPSARRIGSSIISLKTDFPIARCMSAPDLPAPLTAIGSTPNTWPAKGRVNWCFPRCCGTITPWSLPKKGPHPPRNALPCSILIVRRTSGRAMKRGFPRSISPLDRIWRVRWECCCRAWRGADFKWMDKTFKPRSLRPSPPRQIMRVWMHWRYRANR